MLSSIIVLAALALAAWIEFLIVPRCDLSFHQTVLLWHLGVSMLNTHILWKLLNASRRIRLYYMTVVASGLVSLSALLWTPSLAFTDLFWGVIPGTISLDPIISLPPYYLRAWVSLIAILVLIKYRKPYVQLLTAWIAFAVIGQFAPSPFLSISTIERRFKEHADVGPIHIHIEDPKLEEFSASVWAKEFLFHYEQILRRLPPALRPSEERQKNFHFDIFIYASDDSKNRWIHARRTQIGHFPRGEMHLSSLNPSSDIIGHELAHLIHGQLGAELQSYIDPFYFEGFAVAISEPSLENALDDAAAIAKFVSPNRPLVWPRLFKFFLSYPPKASYALAGGYASMALQQEMPPWEFELPPIETLLSRAPSQDKMKWAHEVFSQPPLLYDPLRRDCTRLQHDYAESFAPFLGFSQALRTKLEKLCPNSPALSWKRPPVRPSYAPSGDDPLSLDEFIFYSASLRAKPSHDSKKAAKEILKKWKHRDSSRALAFKTRLEWELKSQY